jgi:nitroreductase
MNVSEAIRKRCSVRQFSDGIIPDDYLCRILEAARWAPSPFNTQPWEFIIIKDMMINSGKRSKPRYPMKSM